MKIECKKTRAGEYVKLIFEDQAEYKAWADFLKLPLEGGDYPHIREFVELVGKIVNPHDPYEDNVPTVTIWQNKMMYLACAFDDMNLAYSDMYLRYLKENNALMEKLLDSYNERGELEKMLALAKDEYDPLSYKESNI